MGLGHLFFDAVDILRSTYPSSEIIGLVECPAQGYGSTTYIVTFTNDRKVILQLRHCDRPLASDDLDLAQRLLGHLVPATRRLADHVCSGGQRVIPYEMTYIPGMTLESLLSRDDCFRLLPTVAKGMGDLLSKCSTGAPLKKPQFMKTFVTNHLEKAAGSVDPYLLPFKSDYAFFIQKVDDILDLPAEITNGDLNDSNVIVAEDGTVNGLVDWEFRVQEVPLGWNAGLVHWLRGTLKGYTYVLHDNAAEIEAQFWTSYLGQQKEPVTAGLLSKVETSMRISALFFCIIADRCNAPYRMPQLRMELEYRIPIEC